jgi:hypothetical protein
MNNQSILSGPPPDRNQKPAQDSVQQPETPKPDTVPQLNEHQAPSDKLEQMKINNEPVLSGAPLDRQTPPADTVKTEVPAQEIIAPKTETPKADTVQQPVQQITQPVQNPVPDTPKQDSIPAAPVVVPDAIKTDTIAPK